MLFLLFVGISVATDMFFGELCSRAPQAASSLTNWCTTKPFCTWQGVLCNHLNKVYSVSISDVPFNLELPLISLEVSSLQRIELIRCGLTGDLASLPSLAIDELNLDGNAVTGFPSVHNLGRLRRFSCSGCQLDANSLSATCENEVNFERLESLMISGNGLEGDLTLCSGPEKFPILRYFNVSNNQLSGRAPAFPNALVYDISNNAFSSVQDVTMNRITLSAEKYKFLTADIVVPLLIECHAMGNSFTASPPQWMTKVKLICDYSNH